ncbi:hypothetical protein LSAT2_014699 [Lamellibrachia satsuma]|nr:hypothetical protein LSAT2_014699 [Lamellibrachia satsuma]
MSTDCLASETSNFPMDTTNTNLLWQPRQTYRKARPRSNRRSTPCLLDGGSHAPVASSPKDGTLVGPGSSSRWSMICLPARGINAPMASTPSTGSHILLAPRTTSTNSQEQLFNARPESQSRMAEEAWECHLSEASATRPLKSRINSTSSMSKSLNNVCQGIHYGRQQNGMLTSPSQTVIHNHYTIYNSTTHLHGSTTTILGPVSDSHNLQLLPEELSYQEKTQQSYQLPQQSYQLLQQSYQLLQQSYQLPQ